MGAETRDMMARRGMAMGREGMSAEGRRMMVEMPPAAATAEAPTMTNEISTITLKCRAVDLSLPPTSIADASATIIYTLQNELRASTNYFVAETTEALGTTVQDPANGTFTFDVKVVLKHPLKP
jgi:hypothetical protein